jgi:hypothetical protein
MRALAREMEHSGAYFDGFAASLVMMARIINHHFT